MSITFLCPRCRQRYTTSDSTAGMTAPCKRCGLALVVPSPASAAAPPASPVPPPQTGPRDLLDLLEDVAASSTVLPPAQPALAPLRPAFRGGQRARGRFEWGGFLKRLVSSPLGIALVIAALGLAVFVVLLIVPSVAFAWAVLCMFVGALMVIAGVVWYLAVFFMRANSSEKSVLIGLPICSVPLSGIAQQNMAAIVGLLGRTPTRYLIYFDILLHAAIVAYGIQWLVLYWRFAWRSFCLQFIGWMMIAGSVLGWITVNGLRGNRATAAPERRADDAAWGRAYAPPEVVPFVPPPVPRPADSPQSPQPFGDLAGNPAPGPDRPVVGSNPPRTEPMDNPAERTEIPGPGPGRMGKDRTGSRVRPGPPGFGPQGIPAARRGRSTDLVGGSGGGPFETAGSGEPVLGFDYRLGSWAGEQAIGDLRPVFARATQGAEPFFPQGAQGAQRVMARDGYAVGALEVDAAEFVNAVRVVFMRVDAQGRLDRNDSYKSDWIGAASGKPAQTLGGDGSKIIGIYGRRMAILDAVGLLLE